MSLTAIIWLLIYVLGCLLALFRHPIYGLVTYLFEYFNHPLSYWWGHELPYLRWSLIIAAITLVALVIHRSDLPKVSMPAHKWLLLLTLVAIFVTYSSPASFIASRERMIDLLKLALLYYLIANTVQREREYRILIWAVIIGCFLLGLRAYLDPSLQGGRLENIGAVDARSSNLLAALLLIPLPFLGFYFLTGRNWEKILSVLVAPFILNTIVLTSSRGAFLAILAMGLVAILPGFKQLRMRFLVIVVLGGLAFAQLATEQFTDRMLGLTNSTELTEQDGSTIERILSWKAGLRLIQDRPFGAGGEGFRNLSPVYIPGVVAAHGELRAPHNTFLKAATDWGILGLALWLLFVGHTLVELRRLSKTTTERRYVIEGICIQTALIGFLVASVFSDRLYAEVLYWVCAMSAGLRHMALHAQSTVVVAPTESKVNRIDAWIVRHKLRRAYKSADHTAPRQRRFVPPASTQRSTQH